MSEEVDPVTILLVDDEPRNLDALVVVLEDPAYRLLRTVSADEALKTLLDHDVAAIVLDIKMPGMSGFELAEVIKGTKKFRQIPILFITAYLMDDRNVLLGYGAGAVDYLTKPINPAVLRHKVGVFAELFRKSRALAELNATLEERVRERTADLERSEAALRAADRQKDEFLAVLAHELRNPLAPLSMGIDLLRRTMPADSPAIVETTLARMKRQLDHGVRLIDDLLDVSRITRGAMDLKRERGDLAAIVVSAAESARPVLDRRGHVATVDALDPVNVFVDPTRVTQIVGNLLHNASKFTPTPSTIRLSVTREGATAVVRVTDQGVGIAPGRLEGIFEMFARSETPASSGERGLGIGLAVARRLAELHGGSLVASSEGEGRGTTFTLRLPAELDAIAPAAQATGGATSSRNVKTRPLAVVVVEDNPDNAETLGEWLRERGHTVWIAGTGIDGVDLVQRHRPDVLICDLGLPDIDGLEVTRRVRAMSLNPIPRFIALTGWGRDDDRGRTRDAGFDEHLVKPVEVDALDRALDAVTPAAHRDGPRASVRP